MRKFVKKTLSSSSKKWIQRTKNNIYTVNAKKDNIPSRSYFKLKEINNKFKLFYSSHVILDLGCCPGGWSYYLKEIKMKDIIIHGCDLLDNMKISIDKFVLGDFTDFNIWKDFTTYNNILSDIAANSTGNRWLDNYQNHNIAEETWKFVKDHLLPKGNFVIKLFESEYTKPYIENLKPFFKNIIKFKPEASHKDSSEIYLICLKYQPIKKE